jgi:hypothetical protein
MALRLRACLVPISKMTYKSHLTYKSRHFAVMFGCSDLKVGGHHIEY